MTTDRLVRDRVPGIARTNGSEASFRVADVREMPDLVMDKLAERCAALPLARPDCLLNELADVIEAAHLLASLHGHSEWDLERARTQRHESHGGFAERWVMRHEK